MSYIPKKSAASGYVPGVNNEEQMVCQYEHMTSSMGCFWFGCDPLAFNLTLFLAQIGIIFLVSRVIFFFLRPIQQSILSCQLIAGMVLVALLRINQNVVNKWFPETGKLILSTLTEFGFTIHVFVIGIQIDVGVLKHVHRHTILMGCMSFFVPYAVCTLCIMVLSDLTIIDNPTLKNLPFVAALNSMTTIPAVTSTLSDLNMLNSELGRFACSTGLVTDATSYLVSLGLTTLGIALHTQSWEPLGNVAWLVAFLLTVVFVFRRFVLWIAKRIPEGQPIKETQFLAVFIVVMLCALLSDCLGQMTAFGAFMMGICVPDGPPFGTSLVNRVNWFSTEILVPAKFAISAFGVSFKSLGGSNFFSCMIIEIVIITSYASKFMSNLILATYYSVPFRDAFPFALIMCNKGIIDIAALTVMHDSGVLTEQSYALLILNMLIVTGIARILVWHFYDPSSRYHALKRSSILECEEEDFLRMLVCIHNEDNVPTIINLLEASTPSGAHPIAVITMNLLELTGRAAAILVPNSSADKIPASMSRVSQIMKAFDFFVERHEEYIMVQHYTAMSPYGTMHEDICTMALDKGANIIIVPFHKRWAIDGTIGATFPGIKTVNLQVMEKAPCSVGVLVDRGQIGGPKSVLTGRREVFRLTQLFLGGVDDREALAYSRRMAQRPNTSFLLVLLRPEGWDMDAETYERSLDREMVDRFEAECMGQESIVIREEVASDAVETVKLLRSMEKDCDLFMVGREHGFAYNQLTQGLTEWSECPELGTIGDLLATSDFKFSVLVILQENPADNLLDFDDDPAFGELVHNKIHPTFGRL